MNYELAKQLKEAGFPQNFDIGDWFYTERVNKHIWEKPRCIGGLKTHLKYKTYKESYKEVPECECDWCLTVLGEMGIEKVIKIPTLSELIEACGEDFQKLEKIISDRLGNKWQGVGGEGIRDIEIEAKFPEEAVAKLWLKLNEK